MNAVDSRRLPAHIAIIMDGNGRWAAQHTLGRIAGHREGAESVRVVVRTCRELGIAYLTLFAFSVENWLRPAQEVEALMRLLQEYLRSELHELRDNGIRLLTVGNLSHLRDPIQRVLAEAIKQTAHNRDMVLNIAVSYGGRDEIVQAARRLAEDVRAGRLAPEDVTKERFSQYLYTAGMPDPDLLIRTSGEYRISNFLLWQAAYTEFYFTDVLWPDFRRQQLIDAIAEFQRRERRFGRTGEQLRQDNKE